jgi:GR25 family glycosyltransferase involved in LPS biosynthesis
MEKMLSEFPGCKQPEMTYSVEDSGPLWNSELNNLNYEFFSAVDGNDPDSVSKFKFKINGWADPNSGKAMTNGEVGCALSHWSIWLDIVSKCKSGIYPLDAKILILEDDVILPQNFFERFSELTSKMGSYDLLYCHRKALMSDAEVTYVPGINSITGAKSYWTCAYVLTPNGAKKLVDSLYLENLIPVDEFLPLMYNCKIFGFEKFHESCEKLEAYAFSPSLIRLCDDAFENSSTFHSEAYEIPNENLGVVNLLDTQTQVILCVISDSKTESRQRLQTFSKIYGYRLEIFATDTLLNIFLSTLKIKTLIVCVRSRGKSDFETFPAFFPIGSPKELLDKYTRITNGKLMMKCVVYANANNDIICGFSNLIGDNVEIAIKKAILDNKRLIFCSTANRDDIEILESKQRFKFRSSGELPCFIYGSSVDETLIVNRIANYSGDGWNYYYGYRVNKRELNFPKIFLAIHYGGYNEIFKLIEELSYPKDKIELHVGAMSNMTEYKGYEKYTLSNPKSYSVHQSYSKLYGSMAKKFIDSDCAYFWMIGEHAVLTNPNVLIDLLSVNKGITAPMIKDPESYGTNFWGDITVAKTYVRAFDYLSQIENPSSTIEKPYARMGCWNVPYISHTVFIRRDVLVENPDLYEAPENAIVYKEFCYKAREKDIHMHMVNLRTYGYMIDPEKVQLLPPNITMENITVADVETYPRLWEEKYLHPVFLQAHRARTSEHVKELHTDIYQYPFFTKAFCKEMIELAEAENKWSKGKGEHKDTRFGANYYENVPTQDVQLFELGTTTKNWTNGLKNQWNYIVMTYMAPLVKRIYSNYKTRGVHMAFIVRYHQDHQNSLEPHHDASTYTLNIALNEAGVEYEGGGCRFIRQNLTVKNQEVGYSTIHAGRLTAYHEGLPITKGVRYILVSFIDN